jgi:hypothetical protein
VQRHSVLKLNEGKIGKSSIEKIEEKKTNTNQEDLST